MEQTFEQMSQQFLAQAAQQYGEPFVIQQNVACCGTTFPMTAGYIKRDGRHFLGIKSDLSQDGMCGETCYFLCCETLTQESWEDLCGIFKKIQDRTVPADDPAHLFTLVSFVIETNHVDVAVKKKFAVCTMSAIILAVRADGAVCASACGKKRLTATIITAWGKQLWNA